MIFRGSIEKRCVENQIVLSAIALAGRAHQDRERGGVEGPSKKWNGGTEERGGRRGQIIIIYDYKRRRDNWAEITPPQAGRFTRHLWEMKLFSCSPKKKLFRWASRKLPTLSLDWKQELRIVEHMVVGKRREWNNHGR